MLVKAAHLAWFLGLSLGAVACSSARSAHGPVAYGQRRDALDCESNALNCCPQNDARVTLCQLLAQRTDLRHLTRLPNPAYSSHMASSFNRASLSAAPGTDGWFANRDYAALTPGEPLQLLDTEGPGVLTRIWSANPSGTLRIYLDGAAKPTIEAPMRELLRGMVPPIGPAFGALSASGSTLYLPIAYQSHCRVTVTSDAHKLFYQVSYRRYAEHARIEPFTLSALRHAMQPKSAPNPNRLVPASQRFTLLADAGTVHTVAAEPGGSMLRELRVRIQNPTAAALRETLLRMWVDGEEVVHTPLGDFFGSGPGLQTVNALPVQVDTNGTLIARWPMPFRTQLAIALVQTHGVPIAAQFELRYEAHAFSADTLLFHAQWQPPQWQSSEPDHEFTLSSLQGNGLFVGTVLNVVNTDPRWWGEGDEKIWIDSERFPSFFGTGTEDYFDYGWCSNQRFSRPYAGQTLAGQRANFGRVSLYRFHVIDAIRFTKRLHFDLEVNHWGDTPTPVAYDSVTYFYARPGANLQPNARETDNYRIPELSVPEPSAIPEAPYRCGGSD